MKLFRLLKSETTRLLIAGFVIGTIGFAAAQPGTAQPDQMATAQQTSAGIR